MSVQKRKSTAGITMPQLLVLIGVTAVLAAIALLVVVPHPFIGARINNQKSGCIANLKQISGAKEQWALENKKTVGTPADVDAINAYLKNSAAQVSPDGGKYSYNPVGTEPTCSLGPTLGHTI